MLSQYQLERILAVCIAILVDEDVTICVFNDLHGFFHVLQIGDLEQPVTFRALNPFVCFANGKLQYLSTFRAFRKDLHRCLLLSHIYEEMTAFSSFIRDFLQRGLLNASVARGFSQTVFSF